MKSWVNANSAKSPSPQIRHEFRWVKENFQDRPAFILEHDASQVNENFAVWMVRQFYVGHTYDSQQLAGVVIPYKDSSILFYENRTSTDLVEQYARFVALPIGNRIMRGEVQKLLENYMASGGMRK